VKEAKGKCVVVMDASKHASTTVTEYGAGLSDKEFTFKQDGTAKKGEFNVPVRAFSPNV